MENTFIDWLHILKFKNNHWMISDGTRNYDSIIFTIENKNEDRLKLNQLDYLYLHFNVWKKP